MGSLVGIGRVVLADDGRMGDAKTERIAVSSSCPFIVHKYLTNL